jgi:hypothetical protein
MQQAADECKEPAAITMWIWPILIMKSNDKNYSLEIDSTYDNHTGAVQTARSQEKLRKTGKP